MKPIAWSHTALSSFETCPRRHYLTRVSKEVIEPQSEAILWGNTVHGAMEDRMRGTAPLPAHLAHYEPLVAQILRRYGTRLIEQKLAIDKSFNPVGWRAPTAWCRGIIDVGLLGPDTAVVGDWKTGKRKPDSDQLRLFAGLMFAHYPYLKAVHTLFLWLKDRKIDAAVFTNTQTGEIWSEFLPRVARLELAHRNMDWPEKPSGLCGKWCPITRSKCTFGR